MQRCEPILASCHLVDVLTQLALLCALQLLLDGLDYYRLEVVREFLERCYVEQSVASLVLHLNQIQLFRILLQKGFEPAGARPLHNINELFNFLVPQKAVSRINRIIDVVGVISLIIIRAIAQLLLLSTNFVLKRLINLVKICRLPVRGGGRW